MRIVADQGIGSSNNPIYTRVNTIAARTQGAAGIFITEADGLTVGTTSISGVSTENGLYTTNGGDIVLTNVSGNLIIKQPELMPQAVLSL